MCVVDALLTSLPDVRVRIFLPEALLWLEKNGCEFLQHSFVLLRCLHMCMLDVNVCAMVHLYRSENNFMEMVFCSHLSVYPRDGMLTEPTGSYCLPLLKTACLELQRT